MVDDRSGRTRAMLGSGAAEPPGQAPRPPRSPVSVTVRCRFPSIIDFVETQSVNISREGMYLRYDTPPDVGTRIDFEVSLDDGFVVMKGSATVVRVVTAGDRGMGLRFAELDEATRKLINRIVEVNLDEGKRPTVPLDFTAPAQPPLPVRDAPSGAVPGPRAMTPPIGVGITTPPAPAPAASAKPIQFSDGKLRVVLSAATASYFAYNPLLNIRMGGFFIPVDEEVPLGTTYKVEIVDAQDQPLAAGKGKVVARQELRIGIRLGDVDKDALTRLQALVTKLAAAK
jgi:uncharacterized protein (TIGR02266 family)